MPDHQLEINPTGAGPIAIPPGEFWDLVLDAIDLARDQDTRTRITNGGKTIAWIVTAEDGERLERLDHPRKFGDLPEAERKALAHRAMAQLGQELSTPQFAAALNEIVDDENDENDPGPTGPDTLRELRDPG